MRRTPSSETNKGAAALSAMTSTTHPSSGYRAVPSTEGITPARPPAPSYGTAHKPRSPATLLCLALLALSSALLVAALVSDMPLTDRLRSVFFSRPAPAPAPTSALAPDAVARLNAMGLALFARLAGSARDVVMSPASIASALTMAAAGATKGSAADKELHALLGAGFASPAAASDPTVQLSVANSAWVAATVKDAYKEDVQKNLRAQVEPLPPTVAPINDWVSKHTGGNIDKILDTMPANVVALLINAVFFKASWTTKFDPDRTLDMPFYNEVGKTQADQVANVRMMRMTKQTFPYTELTLDGKPGEVLQMVEMPYGTKDEYAATIVVPHGKTTISDVATLLKDKPKLWDEWVAKLRGEKLDLMAMPRFKIEYGVKSLKQELQSMGMKASFISDSKNPPFLGMTDDKDAYLDDVLHKATIECTEEGTVASAATAAVVMTRSMPRPGAEVVLDRPFLFAIRNRVSGALLFLARVDKPVSPS